MSRWSLIRLIAWLLGGGEERPAVHMGTGTACVLTARGRALAPGEMVLRSLLPLTLTARVA